MGLRQQSWITFGGDPVTGLPVPQLWVEDGRALTPEQDGAVAHAYRLFKASIAPAAAPYHVATRTLPDGTRVRMESMQGRDRVFVAPPVPGVQPQLENLLVGVAAELSLAGYDARAKYSLKAKLPTTVEPTKYTASRVIPDKSGIRQHPGSLDWHSEQVVMNRKPIVLSWFGRATRYGRMDMMGRMRQLVCDNSLQQALYGNDAAMGTWDQTTWFDAFKPDVWINGIRFAVQLADGTPVPVMSAGLRNTGSGMVLYLVSKDTSLAIYSGPVRLSTKGSTVHVAKLFDIDFTPDTTLHNSPGEALLWNALVQPLYFNASCTKAAGLIYEYASGGTKLITVDIDAHTTTKDYSDSSYVVTTTENVSGMLPPGTTDFGNVLGSTIDTNGDGIDDTGSGSISGTAVDTTEKKLTKYGAIDWDGDTLLVCMTQLTHFVQTTSDLSFSGTVHLGTTTDNPGNAGYHQQNPFTSDWERKAQSKWRCYLVGGATLASKDSGLVVGDTFHYDDVYNATGGTTVGSASRTESFMVPWYMDASIEGGDLRQGLLVTLEAVEEGTSSYTAAFPVISAGSSSGSLGYEWFNESFSPTSEAITQDRTIFGRLRAWYAGSEVGNVGPDDASLVSFGQYSLFSLGYGISDARRQLAGGNWRFNTTGTVTTTNTYPASDIEASFGAYTVSEVSHQPIWTMGMQTINASAFNHDGSAGYVAIGGMKAPTGFATPGSRKSWFIFAGVPVASFAQVLTGVDVLDPHGSVDVDGVVTLDDPPQVCLSAPLFLYNVPKESQ